MKKFFYSLIVLTVMSVLPANAQGVNFGLKAGVNNTNMKFDLSVFDSENRFGWFFGPTVKIGLPVTGLSVDLAANKAGVLKVNRNYYFRVGAKASQSGVGTIRANYAPYVKIPLALN